MGVAVLTTVHLRNYAFSKVSIHLFGHILQNPSDGISRVYPSAKEAIQKPVTTVLWLRVWITYDTKAKQNYIQYTIQYSANKRIGIEPE